MCSESTSLQQYENASYHPCCTTIANPAFRILTFSPGLIEMINARPKYKYLVHGREEDNHFHARAHLAKWTGLVSFLPSETTDNAAPRSSSSSRDLALR